MSLLLYMSIKLETKSENYYLEKYIKYKNKYINLKKKIMKGGNDCIMLNISPEYSEPEYIECTKEGKKHMHVFRLNGFGKLYDNYLYFTNLDEIPIEDYGVISNDVLDGEEHIANPEIIFNHNFKDIKKGQFIIEEWLIYKIKEKFDEGNPAIIMYNKEKNYIHKKKERDSPMECYEYIGYQSVNLLKDIEYNEIYRVCDEAYDLFTRECFDNDKYTNLTIEDTEEYSIISIDLNSLKNNPELRDYKEIDQFSDYYKYKKGNQTILFKEYLNLIKQNKGDYFNLLKNSIEKENEIIKKYLKYSKNLFEPYVYSNKIYNYLGSERKNEFFCENQDKVKEIEKKLADGSMETEEIEFVNQIKSNNKYVSSEYEFTLEYKSKSDTSPPELHLNGKNFFNIKQLLDEWNVYTTKDCSFIKDFIVTPGGICTDFMRHINSDPYILMYIEKDNTGIEKYIGSVIYFINTDEQAIFFISIYKSFINKCHTCSDEKFSDKMIKKLEEIAKDNNCNIIATACTIGVMGNLLSERGFKRNTLSNKSITKFGLVEKELNN